ncbi:MAG: hypothetical protein HFF90_00785 [Oscillibacter sp.]|nr:hypothetical protein [Oscillibacter sp.]
MERLTKRSKYGVELVEKYGFTEIENTARVIYRLAAYEDTGLTPEEIMTLIAPDDPLTLEELRDLGAEWVWIKFLEPVYRMESGYYQKAPQFSDADTFYIGYSKPSLVVGNLPYSGYGYIWLAYRRKPEEA